MMDKNLEQELRQLRISEPLINITVQVCREDFPQIRGKIEVQYYRSAAQQVWGKFIADICKLLKIEFVYAVVERGDKAYVSRILRLKDGGDYLVRQRENSSILEVLNTGIAPVEHSWEITDKIIGVKKDLDLGCKNLPTLHNRIKYLVSQKLTSIVEKETAEKIIRAKQPLDITVALCLLYVEDQEQEISEEELSLLPLNTKFGDIEKFKDKVDVISLHRLALESLNRFVTKDSHAQQLVLKQTIQYVFKIVEQLMHEVDIITIGLRLMSGLMHLLTPYRERCVSIILSALEKYAPPAPAHRARDTASSNTKGIPVATEDLAMNDDKTSSYSFVKSKKGVNRTRDLNALTRYQDIFASTVDRAKYQVATQSVNNFVKILEFDDNFQVISPRTAAKIKEEEEERRRLKELSLLRESMEVVEKKPQQVIIRARDRIDQNAAKNALKVAFTHNTSSQQSDKNKNSNKVRSNQISKSNSHDAESPEQKIDQINSNEIIRPSMLLQQPLFPNKSKAHYRIHKKHYEENSSEDEDGQLNWRGSKGELGRLAIDKRPVSSFKTLDTNISPSVMLSQQISSSEGKLPSIFPSTSTFHPANNSSNNNDTFPSILSQTLSLPLLANTDGKLDSGNTEDQSTEDPKGVETFASITSWVPAYQGPRRKQQLILEKLPDVPCPNFRGFEGQMQANVVLTQGFATLLKMLSSSYSHRNWAFEKNIVEEVAAITLVCAAIPKILEYFVEIVNTMYSEGYGDPANDQASQQAASNDPTMVLSADNITVNDSTVMSMSQTGRVVEMVSELSLPSVDPDAVIVEETFRLNLPEIDEEAPKDMVSATTQNALAPDEASGDEKKKEKKEGGPSAVAKSTFNAGHVALEGDEVLSQSNSVKDEESTNELRYKATPSNTIIMALAMCSAHVEVSEREREAAKQWLVIWNNHTRDFKLALIKGRNLCGL